eukprot:2367287-Prymnesium_polylepis.1
MDHEILVVAPRSLHVPTGLEIGGKRGADARCGLCARFARQRREPRGVIKRIVVESAIVLRACPALRRRARCCAATQVELSRALGRGIGLDGGRDAGGREFEEHRSGVRANSLRVSASSQAGRVYPGAGPQRVAGLLHQPINQRGWNDK